MSLCPTCGSNVPANSDVCPDCGMDLQTVTPAADAAMPPGSAVPAFTPLPDLSDPLSSVADSGISAVERTVVLDPTPVAVAPVTSEPAAVSAPAVPPAATLTLKRGGAPTTDTFVLGRKATLGRFDPESGPVEVDLGPLPEAVYVSRHHAQLRCDENGQWFIKDLGSRNGTFVRSGAEGTFQRVTDDQPLSDGDELSLGNACFEFRTGG